MEEKDVLKSAINKWGPDLQKTVIIEECSELIKEICKYLRGIGNKSNIEEEIADVEIMLVEAEIIYNVIPSKKKNYCNGFQNVISDLSAFSLIISSDMEVTADRLADMWNCIEWIKCTLALFSGVSYWRKKKVERLLDRVNKS